MMAIKTKNIILKSSNIDSAWAFRHLLGLGSNCLNGGDLKINSVFSIDKTPSFSIYKKDDDSPYRYSCFSSGMKGDYFDLYIELQKQKGKIITRQQAINFLKTEFQSFIETGNYAPLDTKVVINGKARVTEFNLRRWNEDDIAYWSRFEIDPEDLEFHNIAPLKHFLMEKLVNGIVEKYEFDHPRIYGYFRNDGSLHKIYRPGSKKGKFIKVGGDYTQGADQIIKARKKLIYIKSTKDGVCFRKLGFDEWDWKAPDGEGILISKKEILKDKETYEEILSWMDPDEAGKKATARYLKEFNIPPVDFDMGVKDLSDSVERWGGFLVTINLRKVL